MIKYDSIDELKKILPSIKEKPGLFLEKKSLIRLSSFIDGFLYAFYLANGSEKYEGFFPGFNKWVAETYGMNSSHGWCSIIMFFEENEATAFDKFFELIEKYFKIE